MFGMFFEYPIRTVHPKIRRKRSTKLEHSSVGVDGGFRGRQRPKRPWIGELETWKEVVNLSYDSGLR